MQPDLLSLASRQNIIRHARVPIVMFETKELWTRFREQARSRRRDLGLHEMKVK